jgi:hypothetical protein
MPLADTAAKLITFEDRLSDSSFVERVWRSHSEQPGQFHSIAACHWEMVVSRYAGKTSLTVRGPETMATTADCPADGEWFAIRFKLGTYMPLLRPGQLRNRNDVTLPDASSRSFWLNGSALEYPNFDNAETFVQRLVRDGLIAVDPTVDAVLHHQPQSYTTRTAQRRFLQVTGLTRGTIHQIQRARRATLLLKQGVSILDAAYEAGYYDQAHLTRSLQRFIGQTPGQIITAQSQLSFLYNTQPA